VAISDKLDTLVGFWAIDEKPTGSRDPYALRRSALGVVRTLIESKSRLHLRSWLEKAWFALVFRGAPSVWPYQVAKELRLSYAEGLTEFAPVAPPSDLINARSQQILTRAEYMGNLETLNPGAQIYCYPPTENGVFSNLHVLSLGAHLEAEYFAICQYQVVTELLVFLADRLKVQLRDQGKRHDLVDAVFALGDDDLVRIVARVEALDAFLKTEDGANILAGYRRAANILAAEEKKGQGLADADVNVGYQKSVLAENPQPAEQALLDAVNRIGPDAKKLVKEEQFGAAMTALAGLRAPLDLFFEQVLVNDPKPDVRRNRLLLLTQIRDALSAVADFSKIEG
jgi:glycyl-tRNA synthetase beta chain